MTQATFATHEVLNQSPPFEDIDLYAVDRPLVEAVAANGSASAQSELCEFGKHWGSAAMAERAGCRHGEARFCELLEGVVALFAAGRRRTRL